MGEIIMRKTYFRRSIVGIAAAIGLASGFVVQAQAEQIVVSNYGVTVNGMPYAVAEALGFFKEEGADVTGILSSGGGGSTIRNLLGGNHAYAESSLAAIVAAHKKGADLKIISGNAHTVAEFYWVVLPNSPIKSIKELKGKKLGFTNPRSTTQAMDVLLLNTLGIKREDVTLVKTGGFGPMVVALQNGGIDVAPFAEPVYTKQKNDYRVLVAAPDVLPAVTNVVGVTIGKVAESKGDFIRAVIRARRRAVEYIYFNPVKAAKLIAPAYKLEVPVVEEILLKLIASTGAGGVPYWGPGDIRYEPMDNMIKAQKDVGAISGEVQWSDLIDESFLPKDLRGKK
jgi:NitT/TauT family transport system substrate-binding protein